MKSEGIFTIPHIIYDNRLALAKSTKSLFIALFALQDKYIFKLEGRETRIWFNVSIKTLKEMTGFCKDTIRTARDELMSKGLIDFKKGFKGRNSDYCILIDKFVELQMGKKLPLLKTNN